jgi:hypothetical protein
MSTVPRTRARANVGAISAAALLALGAVVLSPARAAAKPAPESNEGCQECHADKKTERKKPPEGRKASVYVDNLGLARSEHRGMSCVDCHAKVFAQDPHPQARRALCQDCHVADESREGGVKFAQIDRDFQKSVHVEKSKGFACVACHDAHAFQLDTTRARVFEHNKVCLRCHSTPIEYQGFVNKAPTDLAKAHEWLPNRDLHWSRVRCLDCHTGLGAPPGSHLIVPKSQAVKRCESCHNQNPTQLLRLYGRMRGQEVARLGFINAFIINDSYVIGATRSWWMDIGAILIMGGTGAGIAGHGALRMLAWFVRRKTGWGVKHDAHHGHGDHEAHDDHGRNA